MNEQNCSQLLIEELGVSESCLDGLRKSGFITVGELTEFFAKILANPGNSIDPHPFFLLCIDDVVTKLKEIGCWPGSLEE